MDRTAVFLLLHGLSSKPWVLELQSQAEGIPTRDCFLRRWQPQESTSQEESKGTGRSLFYAGLSPVTQFYLPLAHLTVTALGTNIQICSHSASVPLLFQRCAGMSSSICFPLKHLSFRSSYLRHGLTKSLLPNDVDTGYQIPPLFLPPSHHLAHLLFINVKTQQHSPCLLIKSGSDISTWHAQLPRSRNLATNSLTLCSDLRRCLLVGS